MKKLITVAALISVLISTEAFANSENFKGANVSLGASLTNYNSTWTYNEPGTDFSTSLGHSGIVGVLGASYLMKLQEKFLLGLGATYDINDTTAGESKNNVTVSGNYVATSKVKNHYSIYLQPTYALSDKTALFAKIAYHNAKVEISDSGQLIQGGVNHYQDRIKGAGYGFGFMHFVDKNIFVKAEIEWVEYNKKSIPREYHTGASGTLKYKLTSTAGVLSLGYRF